MHIALHNAAHNAPDLTQPITVIELILLAVIIAQINQDHVIQYDKGLIILRMPYKNKTVSPIGFWWGLYCSVTRRSLEHNHGIKQRYAESTAYHY